MIDMIFSVTCRLPQTPRTPTAAASHYFDDTFSRQARVVNERKPAMLRRSSTHRSIGRRSDWDSAAPSENGDGDETQPPSATTVEYEPHRRWTIFEDDEQRKKERETVDEHVQNYVQDQLKRLMIPDGPAAGEEELETHVNGV